MASPQKENGYTAIANELLEAFIVYRFTEYQRLVILHIWRKTYGFNKRDDWIANSQFVEAIGIGKQNVSKTVRGLIDKKVVIRRDNRLRVNKNWEEWGVIPRDNNSYLYRLQKLSPQIPQKTKAKNNISTSVKKPSVNKSMRILESEESPTIRIEDGEEVVPEKVMAHKKRIADTTKVIQEFDRLWAKMISENPKNKPRATVQKIRTSVIEALKMYSADELINMMPQYFNNDTFRGQAWAIWTMMSYKVLNNLKNEK